MEGLDPPFFEVVVTVTHFGGHVGDVLGEFDHSVTVPLDFLDQILEFSISGVSSHRFEDGSELVDGNGRIFIHIELGEDCLSFIFLFFREVLSHKVLELDEHFHGGVGGVGLIDFILIMGGELLIGMFSELHDIVAVTFCLGSERVGRVNMAGTLKVYCGSCGGKKRTVDRFHSLVNKDLYL
jgi:hypothetical protein